MAKGTIPLWKEAPFIRLLVPLTMGIVFQEYCPLSLLIYGALIGSVAFLFALASHLRPYLFFKYYRLTGIGVYVLLASLGAALCTMRDIRFDPQWIGNALPGVDMIMATIDEVPFEKNKTYKANATVEFVAAGDSLKSVKGTIIVYFAKDLSFERLRPTDRILIRKTPVPVPDKRFPGDFDYKRYCALQGIFHQVFLKKEDVALVNGRERSSRSLLAVSRDRVTSTLKKNIPGAREAGLAEALLIGYKNDLDKLLVQQYIDTGVVHVIAISGMHIALIYWIINLFLAPFFKQKKTSLILFFLTAAGLWGFSLLAGGSPSVLRAAVMFTFIVAGENIKKKRSVYNSLAGSAFLLLCYNPYWLWDAGFQLSYAAVLSLVVFMKPIYHLIYIQNKLLDAIWKAATVSIAAQILTLPISIFYFHQFPNYFLLSNLVAVPLSSLIVLAEIVILVLCKMPFASAYAGELTSMLIRILNLYIEYIAGLPFARLTGLMISLPVVVIFYITLYFFTRWISDKQARWLIIALVAMLCSAVVNLV